MAGLDEYVQAYRNIRDAKTKLTRSYKDECGVMDEQAAALLKEIRAQLDGLGVESVKTKFGTAFKTTKDFVNVAEIEDFRKFLCMQATDGNVEQAEKLLEIFPFQFFTKAISKEAVKQFMKDGDGATPDGVKYDEQIEIQIRK
jgi:hypothetical protein